MNRVQSSRRKFLSQYISGIAFLFSAGFFVKGCKPKVDSKVQTQSPGEAVHPCENLENISETDLALRTKLGYLKESPIADNQCQNCNLFLPPKGEEKCGGCMLFKGPVYPEGYCTYWAPRV